jgi:hypothetical protein
VVLVVNRHGNLRVLNGRVLAGLKVEPENLLAQGFQTFSGEAGFVVAAVREWTPVNCLAQGFQTFSAKTEFTVTSV